MCVVACSGGYPGDYEGRAIFGLDDQVGEDLQSSTLGPRLEQVIQTAGSRVLAVTALGADADAARERAYEH